ncbi:MAG: hypothetical protein LUE88_00270 [Clostridiales bacterium]|nr:hypothetical protein [Clostridiales bacterium]
MISYISLEVYTNLGILPIPGIFLLFSVIAIFSFAAIPGTSTLSLVFSMIITFVIYNIPTAIYLAIYFVCRSKYKKKKQIDKMNIQDL